MLGLLALTEVLPLIVLPIVGGAIADAVERRRFLMIAQGATAVLSVALAANAFLPDPQVWVLFVFSFLSASAYSLYSPAFRAWPARILTPDLFTSSLALEVVYYQSAALAGPVLAGVLIYAYGVGWVYVLDAVELSRGDLRPPGMRPSPATAERLSIGWSSIREGLRFLRGKQVLQGTFYIDLIAMIFGIPVVLYPAFTRDVLGGTPVELGFLYAAEALGALLVALLSGRAKHVRRQGLVTIVACMCWGAGHHRIRPRAHAPGRDPVPDAGERVGHGERALPRRDLEDRHPRRDARADGGGQPVGRGYRSVDRQRRGRIPRVAHDDPDLDRVGRDRLHHRRRNPRRSSCPRYRRYDAANPAP